MGKTIPPWQAYLDFYEARAGDDRAIVMLDLAARAHAPLASHPLRLQVRVKMRGPRDDGLRSSEEADALFALEDRLVESMSETAEAIFVGRVVSQGYTELFFYVPRSGMREDRSPLAVVGDTSPYRLEWLIEEDAGWQRYDELFPNAYAMQTILNRRLVAQMVESGDQIAIARRIDHVVWFPSEKQARAAARKLRAIGFRLDPLEAPSDDEAAWCLGLHRVDRCDGRRPDEFVSEILDAVLPLGGEYDGWGSPVQKG
jgi:hypothetical protein